MMIEEHELKDFHITFTTTSYYTEKNFYLLNTHSENFKTALKKNMSVRSGVKPAFFVQYMKITTRYASLL